MLTSGKSLFAALVLCLAASAQAANFTITESTVCSDATAANCPLIRFIEQANANAEADTIDLGGHTVSLTVRHNTADALNGGGNALPSIVAGGGGLTIRNGTIEREGSDNMRLMHVASDGDLRLFDVMLRGGGQPDRIHGGGGAIFSSGTLLLERCTVTGNSALASGGGGIFVRAGTTTLVNSTVSGNAADKGSGGGLAANGAGRDSPRIVLIHSTVTDNLSGAGGGLLGNNGGSLTLRNNLISGNTDTSSSSRNEAWFQNGQVTSEGGNLFGHSGLANTLGFTPGPKDLVPAGALNSILDTTLADNGGPTQTHALLPGSPAVNAITSGCTAGAIDQRGVPRPETSECDIGAFELSGSYVVTSLSDTDDGSCDAGHCSLREAIRTANGTAGIPDTISFNIPGGGVIALASQLPEITSAGGPVRIDGPTDAAQAIVIDGRDGILDGNGIDGVRLMQTAAGSALNLNHLTLRNGRTQRTNPVGAGEGGGAIRARGALTVNNCVLTGNEAGGGFAGMIGGPGGAIEATGAALTITGSTLSNNRAGAFGGFGGAIYATGTTQIIGSTLSDNAAGRGAGILLPGGNGGAIWANGTLTIENSRFTNNAAGNTNVGAGGAGGAIWAGSSLTIRNSQLSGNNGGFPANGPGGDGGAIVANGALTIIGSTLSGNRAGDGLNDKGGSGGAIRATAATLIANSTVTGNSAGASRNSTAGSGGAISAAGTLTLINTTLHDNALGASGSLSTPASGTAVHATGPAPTLINTILSGSSATVCAGFSSPASGRSNLATDTSCGGGSLLVGGAPVTVAALNLGMLASNGGPTQTLALQDGSVAIDAGSDTDCAADPVNGVDQRGIARPQGGRCDVGAVEATLGNVSLSKSASTDRVMIGESLSFTLSTRNLDSKPVSSVLLSDTVPDAFRIDAVNAGTALCTTRTNTVTCVLPTLAPNGTATVSIAVTASTAGVITNTATVNGGSHADIDLRDNSSSASVTVVAQDTTPDAISFASVNGVARGSTQTSASATVSGINVSTPISVSSGSQYSIGCTDTGFTNVAGTIGNGQTVCVRHTAASAFGNDTVTTLAIGDGSATFTSTTEARDITPEAFRFDSVIGVVEPGSTQRSGAITVSGINDSTPFSVTGGAASTNGLPCDPLLGATSGTVSNGTQITVCHIAGSFGSINTTTLTLGADGVLMGTSASFSSTTRDAVVVPGPFTFGSITGVERGSQPTSTTITITGIEAAVSVSVDIGEVSINGGAFGSGGTIEPGQTVQVRHTASAAFAGTVTSTVTIGGVQGTFSSTTRDAVVVPNAFLFASNANAERGSTQTSNVVTIAGLEAAATVTVSNGLVSINGGAFGSGGTIEPGQTVQVRHTASAAFAGPVTSTVSIGGVQGTFSSTTRDAVVIPNAFTFNSNTNVERSSVQTSNVVTITGLEAAATVTVSNGTVSINGGAFGSGGTIEPGQTVQVRHTASSAFAGTVTSTVTIGGVQGSFSSTTRDAVVVPNAFTFNSNTNVERGSVQTSNVVTITGLEAAATVTVSNGEVSINGGAFGSGGTIEQGQTVQVRHTASAAFAGTVTSTVTIGSVQGSFSSTTVAEARRPVLSLDNTDLQFDRGLVLRFRDITLNTRSAPEVVTLTNTGNAPLTISRISTTGDFRHTTTCGTTVAPGTNCTISIVFRPTDVGTRTGETRIVSDAASSPDLIRLSGTGKGLVPGIRTSASSVDFGTVKLGSSRSRTVTITSSGTGRLEIRSVVAGGDYSSSHNCPRLLDAGKRCTVTTRFRPTAKGLRPGNLTITTSAPGTPTVVALTGNGS